MSSNELTYDTVVELLPAYTLGALEPDEMVAMDDYLQRHHALLERIERLDDATAQLAYMAPATPMSPRVKSTLMSQIRAEAIPARTIHLLNAAERVTQNLPAIPKDTPLLPARQQEPVYALARPVSLRAPQPALPHQPPPRRFDFGWLAAVAMTVAALFIVWIDFGAQRQLVQLRSDLATRTTQLTELNRQLQVMQDQMLQNQQQMAFFATPSQIVSLGGTADAPDAGGVFYQHDDRALVVLHGLPPLTADQTYQLWLIPAAGAPVPAGELTVQSLDVNRQQVTLPAVNLAYQTYQKIGITIEPAGGSPVPTGALVLLGEKT